MLGKTSRTQNLGLTNLLLKIKRQARKVESRETPREPVKFMKEKQVAKN